MRRARVLIVNCYLDASRAGPRRPRKVPQALAPVLLAGVLAPARCEVRLHCELAGGPLLDRSALAWADMLVLTGLTSAMDRMRQLTAYARTANPAVVVVAGGHAVRSFPVLSRSVFDYACRGDVEELAVVARAVFGPASVAEPAWPRYDLAPWIGRIGYAESSRNCNFRCGFCSLTAEGRRHVASDPVVFERQLLALGRRAVVILLDNNFAGPDRAALRARIDVLRAAHAAGRFRAWGALVTADFLRDDALLGEARAAGCRALFSGIESLDVAWLRGARKMQNVRDNPLDLIRRTLDAGIMLSYGLVFDPSTRRVAEVDAEIECILATPDVTTPAYVSIAAPYPGTPFFDACALAGRLLPNTRVRDLDGATVCVASLDPLDAVARFAADLVAMRGRRARILRHAARFAWRYRRRLDAAQLGLAVGQAVAWAAPDLASTAGIGRLRRAGSHVSSTARLDAVYAPTLPVAPRYRHLFDPVMLTDASGSVLEGGRAAESTGASAQADLPLLVG